MKHKVEAKIKFVVGSRYFFDGLSGFNSKDTDELWILDEPLLGKKTSFLFKNPKKHKDIVLYPSFTKEEFIQHDLDGNDRMKFGKYIIPEFAEYIGLTIDDLPRLQLLLAKLDKQHLYQQVIYNAYLENGDFTLTPDQREAAYESYKAARTDEELKILEERKKAIIAKKREERRLRRKQNS